MFPRASCYAKYKIISSMRELRHSISCHIWEIFTLRTIQCVKLWFEGIAPLLVSLNYLYLLFIGLITVMRLDDDKSERINPWKFQTTFPTSKLFTKIVILMSSTFLNSEVKVDILRTMHSLHCDECFNIHLLSIQHFFPTKTGLNKTLTSVTIRSNPSETFS